MAGKIKQKLASLLVEALSEQGAIPFSADKLRVQRNGGSINCDWAKWTCFIPTKHGYSIEVFGWDTMSECVRHGLSLSKDNGFYDVYADHKDA